MANFHKIVNFVGKKFDRIKLEEKLEEKVEPPKIPKKKLFKTETIEFIRQILTCILFTQFSL